MYKSLGFVGTQFLNEAFVIVIIESDGCYKNPKSGAKKHTLFR